MWKGPGLIGQYKHSASGEAGIRAIQRGLVPGSEVISWNGNPICHAQPNDAIAVVDRCRRRRSWSRDCIVAVVGRDIYVFGGLGGNSRTGLPDPVAFSIWRSAPHTA